MSKIRLGIVGVGKIVRDQHLPAIAANPAFELTAVASPRSTLEGTPSYPTIEAMFEAHPELDAVSLCMPPQARHAPARTALLARKHVFLEKPPGATVSELDDLRTLADKADVSVFASWHSRFAPGVAPAKAWLTGRTVLFVRVRWKEDVRRWHPGQAWIWEPGGLGVFDPGINALSIVTEILPQALMLQSAELIFPANRAAPIAADLQLQTVAGAPVHAEFDWRQTGPQSWDIEVETADGTLCLRQGGAKLFIDEAEQALEPEQEYPGLYARFAELIGARRSELDGRPLQLVADAFMLGRRLVGEAFED